MKLVDHHVELLSLKSLYSHEKNMVDVLFFFGSTVSNSHQISYELCINKSSLMLFFGHHSEN